MDLAGHIQNLPPELYNIIYDFTFSVSAGEQQVTIDKAYRSPARLQVDSTSRRAFAEPYYKTSTFHVQDTSLVKVRNICRHWLASLRKEHHSLLRHIHLESFADQAVVNIAPFRHRELANWYFLTTTLKMDGVELGRHVIRWKVKGRRENGEPDLIIERKL